MTSATFPFAKLEFDEDLNLTMNGRSMNYQPRLLRDISEVLLDQSLIDQKSGERVLYKMYRWAILEPHRALFENNGLRFDITIMAPGLLGEELNKTMGHYHPKAVRGLSFPEMYQVLYGSARFLLQRMEKGLISDFRVVEAEAGDTILIPPNFGHVTVNVGDEPMVMSNLVSGRFSSDYSGYVAKRGAAYYLLRGNILLPNTNYGSVPEPKFTLERYPISKDLYTDFISCPPSFAFLNDPARICRLR